MFNKNVLVFDVETTGTDIDKHEMIQIGAVLLDKDTLQELGHYVSYVKPMRWEQRNQTSMEVNGITFDMLEHAPELPEALKGLEIVAKPAETQLCSYSSWIDMGFLRQSYYRIGSASPYDHHCFDIWPLAYMYWQQYFQSQNTAVPGFHLADVAKLVGIQETQYHDALADSRATAELLRRLLLKIKIV